MASVIFSATPVVCISITGEEQSSQGNYPRTRDDGGLVGRFLKFQAAHDIYPAVRGGMSGGGRYIGFFAPEDARKIAAWLVEQGATRV